MWPARFGIAVNNRAVLRQSILGVMGKFLAMSRYPIARDIFFFSLIFPCFPMPLSDSFFSFPCFFFSFYSFFSSFCHFSSFHDRPWPVLGRGQRLWYETTGQTDLPTE
jgi:hypothetical protein